MSIYKQLAASESYVKCLTNVLPNWSHPYDEKAFLDRFRVNISRERRASKKSPLLLAALPKVQPKGK